MRVDMLTRERSRDLQALDDEFRDIMDEGGQVYKLDYGADLDLPLPGFPAGSAGKDGQGRTYPFAADLAHITDIPLNARVESTSLLPDAFINLG